MGTRERTLIVSHDPGLTGQIRGAIQVLGGSVLSTGDATRARADIKEFGLDLVIAATALPGTDGYELCRQIKEERPDTKVMLVYGHGDSVAARRCTEAGADATITRPVRGAVLSARLEALVGKSFFLGVDGTDDSWNYPRAAASIIDPMTGVFPASEAEVLIDDGGSWAESVVSAAIKPLDDEELGPDATQDLPEMALEEFDPEHPVSVPVDSGTTAHFKPIKDPEAGNDEDEASASSSQIGRPSDASMNAFLPAQDELDSADDLKAVPVEEIVRAEIERLTKPGGALAQTIESSIASAVANAMQAVLPALAKEAARMAGDAPEE
ncbi:MAG: response regulator [Proteobacteria bacterium]|nr:response regulator [Pseudomonadota bacterium]